MKLLLEVLFIFILSKFNHTKGDDSVQFWSKLMEKRDGILLANIFKRSTGHFRMPLSRQPEAELRSSRTTGARADSVAAEAEEAENMEDMAAVLQRRKRWMKYKDLKHGHAANVAGDAVINTRHFGGAVNHAQKEGHGFVDGGYRAAVSSGTSGSACANRGFQEGQKIGRKGHETAEATTSRGSVGIPRAFPSNFHINALEKEMKK